MISVHSKPILQTHELSQELLRLDLSSYMSDFFTTSFWIISWLESLPTPPQVFYFCKDEKVIGIALLNITQSHKLLPMHTKAWLNQMGDMQSDQSWIEFNKVYCHPEDQAACSEALAEHLLGNNVVYELFVSMTTELTLWSSIAEKLNKAIDKKTITGFRRHLGNCCTAEKIIETLSKNSRSQLRRAIKKTQSELGPIELSVASDSQTEAYLAELAQLHIKQWEKTKEGSGFKNSIFTAQHDYLLKHASEFITLLKVTAGETILGYTYNFTWQDTVYFYCSGVNHEIYSGENHSNTHLKPGYVLHLYAMAYFAEKGFTTYDFLGGDSQYKRTLANEEYNFYQVSIYNDNATGKLLSLLKRFNRWRKTLIQ